jgi:UDP-glucose:(heptosyl)LPS alpha-1,3-glucosyltransferase
MLVKPSIGGAHKEGEIRRIRSNIAYPLFLKALRKIDLFAVLDDLTDEDLASIGIPPERRRRVDNGIDLRTYQPADPAQKARLRRQFGLRRQHVLLYCGQLSDRKGIVELLDAWTPELARRHDTTLVLCGDGPLRQRVQQAVVARDGDMAYLGSVPDASAIIRMADVLILPSRCESFGNVVMEALASGVPVAATPCGIAPRVLADEQSGWLMLPTDRDSIKMGVARVFSDMSVWRDKGRAGRLVAELYSMDRIARDYLAIYREMIVARHSPTRRGLCRD